MKKFMQLTLVLSLAVLTSATTHGIFRGIGNAVGDVLSTSGRATTGALDLAKGTVGRVTGVRTESGLITGPRGRGVGFVRRAQVMPGRAPQIMEEDFTVAPRAVLY